MSIIEARLSQLGIKVSSLFKPEVQELQKVLMDGEEIVAAVPGRYFGGFALLAATNRRVILIDKKSMFLTVEIVPYDMVSEVNFNGRLLDASIVLFTVNKQHRFTCVKHKSKLQDLSNYVQQRMMELRYGGGSPNQSQQIPEPGQQFEAPIPQLTSAAPMPVPSLPPDPQPTHHHYIAPIAQVPGKIKHQLVGAAALHGTPWLRVNPYSQTSFTMRRQYSRFS